MKTIEQRVDILFKDINSIYALDFTEGEVLLAKSLIRRTLEEALAEASRVEVPRYDGLQDEAFFNEMCSVASEKHGVGECNGAFKDGAEWAYKWTVDRTIAWAIDQMRKGERK